LMVDIPIEVDSRFVLVFSTKSSSGAGVAV